MATQHSDLHIPSWRWIGWRWWAAAILFLLGFGGLLAGVDVSERPGVADASNMTKAYYTLGLFVVGGLDIGTPQGGPWLARTALWIAYFGAPLLTASAVIEAATRILDISPRLEGKVILHCHNLRFMRSVQQTNLATRCEIFNTYNIAATGLVHAHLIEHFAMTASRDTVVMAGFGRFGQSVLEELHAHAANDIESVAVIDADADRRVLVVDEQARIGAEYQRLVFEGDIAHPNVWYQLTQAVDLSQGRPTIILGTGQEQHNLRTALWIKQKYPNAKVFARTNDFSQFALTVGNEHGINNISMTQLVEENVPLNWLA